MQVEWMAFVHVWSRYQALLRYLSPGAIQYYLDVDLEIQLSFIVILSDVLRPNIQRLQDHRANLGINAADGIQRTRNLPICPICSGWIPNTVFPMYFHVCRVSILGQTITSLKLFTLHCFNPGRMPIWSISKQHWRCRCCKWVKGESSESTMKSLFESNIQLLSHNL